MKVMTAQQAVYNNFFREQNFRSTMLTLHSALNQIRRESVLKYETEIEGSELEILDLQIDLRNLGYEVEQIGPRDIYVSWFPSRVL